MKINLSIIIPVYNEINLIEDFSLKLKETFKNVDTKYIFVDDGSSDGTNEILNKNIKEIYRNEKIEILNLKKNYGKGYAVRKGFEYIEGDFVIFIDSDMEYNPNDALEMYNIVRANNRIKILFGSRYMGGKIQHRKHLLNDIAVRLNTLIFNFLFDQSITDLHSGTKIIHKTVIDNLKLTINGFGFEIDISSKIAKKDYRIYEYGISYLERTKKEGKKITVIDGILSYYYLFKSRFIDNDIQTIFSIIFSTLFMTYAGTFFGMGIGTYLVMMLFFIVGLILGIKNKIIPLLLIFASIYLGSLFSMGNGRIYTILASYFIGLYIVKKINNYTKKINKKFILNFFI